MPKPSRYRKDGAERLALSTYLKLTRASDRLWDQLALGLQREDLTPSQFGVLEALYHLGPMCQRDLGERILRSSGNMTLVVGNLERRGLVRRERPTGDGRMREVHLTEAGDRLIRRVFPPHAAAITRALAVLTSEEQRTLATLCRKLGAA
jgi:MarR family 2-MHQ and catechol resistance regulon transcriptional repressor